MMTILNIEIIKTYTDAFKKDIYEIVWSLATGNTDVRFLKFLEHNQKTLDKRAPLKKTVGKKKIKNQTLDQKENETFNEN